MRSPPKYKVVRFCLLEAPRFTTGYVNPNLLGIASASKHVLADMTLETGTPAPAFTLQNQDGKEISLASHQGQKVVVYFYPAASTPGCTTQACELRDNINSLKSLGYAVLGISPYEPKKLKKFQ